ncbi:MAG: hypothetical protein KQI35_07765 [Bacteroidetes bacterium]|nr:hypothetical protein [Bacteroidota bacterium]
MILTFATIGLADAPPDPGGDPGTGGGTPVGGSPIGSGFIITMTLAMVYGSRKVITMNKEK